MIVSEMPDSPSHATLWCPGCDLAADPTREILQVYWCFQHEPSHDGLVLYRRSGLSGYLGKVLSSSCAMNVEVNMFLPSIWGWCVSIPRRGAESWRGNRTPVWHLAKEPA